MRWPTLLATPSDSDPTATVLVHPMKLIDGRVLLQLEVHAIGDLGPDDERNAQVELDCAKLDAFIDELLAARAWMSELTR